MYLHRLAHFPLSSYISNVNAQKQLPIPEVKSCQLISGDFNIKAIQSACEILKRKHGFGSFKKFARNDKDEILTRRLVNELKIVPGHPRFHPAYDKQHENLKFWDVFVSVTPFLRCSVHYMIGLLIGVGKGKIHLRDVEAIISDSSMYSKIKIAEPDGLYLLNVEYPPEAFSEETDEQNTEEAAAKSVQK